MRTIIFHFSVCSNSRAPYSRVLLPVVFFMTGSLKSITLTATC